MNAEVLTPRVFGESEDARQVVSSQRRGIEIPTMVVSPLRPLFVQKIGENLKKYRVIRADRVVSDRQFQRHRDKGKRDNESRAQIASGAHASKPSSFSAFNVVRAATDYCQPSTTNNGTSSNGLIGVVDGSAMCSP